MNEEQKTEKSIIRTLKFLKNWDPSLMLYIHCSNPLHLHYNNCMLFEIYFTVKGLMKNAWNFQWDHIFSECTAKGVWYLPGCWCTWWTCGAGRGAPAPFRFPTRTLTRRHRGWWLWSGWWAPGRCSRNCRRCSFRCSDCSCGSRGDCAARGGCPVLSGPLWGCGTSLHILTHNRAVTLQGHAALSTQRRTKRGIPALSSRRVAAGGRPICSQPLLM